MKELMPLLERLAEKLGTTAEHLWGILMAQVAVEIRLAELWQSVALYGCGGLALACFVAAIVGVIRDRPYSDAPAFGFSFAVVFAFFGTLAYYLNYSLLITLRTNPEYWALSEILKNLQ